MYQTTMTAFRTLESNINEAQSLKNQVASFEQQAKHFVQVPMSYVDEISAMYQQYNGLLREAQGISYTLNNSVSQFESLYSTATQGNGSISQRAQAMLAQVRNASRAATAVTAIWEKLCLEQGKVSALVAVSQAAPGTLAAQQATNQLLMVLSTQQGSLQAIAATSGRMQASVYMQQVVTDEMAAQWVQQRLADWPTAPTWAPGQGHGPKLP